MTELRLDVTTPADTGGLDETAVALEAVDHQLDKLDHSATGAARAADELGDELRQVGRDAAVLAAEVEIAEARVKSLGQEFARTGDRELFGDLNKARSELSQLKRIADEITPDLGKSTPSAAAPAKALADATVAGFAGSGAAMPILIAAAITAGAPLIGAAVASAILLGVGGGGLAVGIASAMSDQAVTDAWHDFASKAGDVFLESGGPFEAPLIQAFGRLGELTDRIDLKGILAPLADEVGPVVDGVIGLVDRAMPGIQRAVTAAAPLIDVLAKELPGFGDSIGDFFDSIADSGPGAEAFLRDFIQGLGLGIELLGDLIQVAAAIYEPISNIARGARELVSEFIEDASRIADALGLIPHPADGAATAIKGIVVNTEEGQAAIEGFNRAIVDFIGLTRTAYGTAIGYERALDNLTDSMKKNGSSFDITTEAGRRNSEMLKSLIDAAEREYQANVTVTGSVVGASAAYANHRATIEDVLRAQGKSEEEIRRLIGTWGGVRPAYSSTYSTPGLPGAIDAIDMLARRINAIDRYVTVRATVVGDVTSGLGHRAAGGPVTAGQPYIVGEERPELFVPDTSGVILPSVPGATHGGSAGGGRVGVDFSGVGSGGLDRLFAEWFMGMVRTGKIQVTAGV